jgi:hypothetical protein
VSEHDDNSVRNCEEIFKWLWKDCRQSGPRVYVGFVTTGPVNITGRKWKHTELKEKEEGRGIKIRSK